MSLLLGFFHCALLDQTVGVCVQRYTGILLEENSPAECPVQARTSTISRPIMILGMRNITPSVPAMTLAEGTYLHLLLSAACCQRQLNIAAGIGTQDLVPSCATDQPDNPAYRSAVQITMED